MERIGARTRIKILNPFRRDAVANAEKALLNSTAGSIIPTAAALRAVMNHILSENLPPNPYYDLAEDFAREAMRSDRSWRQRRRNLHMAQAELILAICTDKRGC